MAQTVDRYSYSTAHRKAQGRQSYFFFFLNNTQHTSNNDALITHETYLFFLWVESEFSLLNPVLSSQAQSPFIGCLFIYTSLRLVLRSLGAVIEGFICCQGQGCFSGCSRLRAADTISETASVCNIACSQAYLHLLYLLPSRFQHIHAELQQ